ncbi:MAG: SRPBCC domain-containing protein [Actinomycetota bacterium]
MTESDHQPAGRPDASAPDPTTDGTRSLEFEVEVPGTPEQVWEAIATGPGISSWFVPHTVAEQEGGATVARFGPGDGMEMPGRVAAWEPPNRVVFEDAGDEAGMAYEWLVEARDGGTCVVRLVNSGFGTGDHWDEMYDGMGSGWPMFLRNLTLHLTHFPGQAATAALPGTTFTGDRAELWAMLADKLGFPPDPKPGDDVTLQATDQLAVAGTVAGVSEQWFAVVTEKPERGTALFALETIGDRNQASVWLYLYGEAGAAAAARDEVAWQTWLEGLQPA